MLFARGSGHCPGLWALPAGCSPPQPAWHTGQAALASPPDTCGCSTEEHRGAGISLPAILFLFLLHYFVVGRERRFILPSKRSSLYSPPCVVFYTTAPAAIGSLSEQGDGAQRRQSSARAGAEPLAQLPAGPWGAKHRGREGSRAG